MLKIDYREGMRATKYSKCVVKWPGGKRQLLPNILSMVPSGFETYYEPFVGGGAVFFALNPKRAVINDLNNHLIILYSLIKLVPTKLKPIFTKVFNGYLSLPKEEEIKHSETQRTKYYIKYRTLFNSYTKELNSLEHHPDLINYHSIIEYAAWFLFLNHTSFNGLVRYNKRGEFNVPHGKRKSYYFPSEEILDTSVYMNGCDCKIYNQDFQEVTTNAQRKDFVYFDPPYLPLNATANFTQYNPGGFGLADHQRLKEECDRLTSLGTKWLQSNSATPKVFELYSDYNIKVVPANRSINCKGEKRGKVDEVLIWNY